jgi:hypothetical protein
MSLYGTLASLSTTAASNAADGSVDAPSTIDQQTNLLASFIAQLRDNVGGYTSGRLLNIQVFGANGTYTPTTGTNSVVVHAVGAGGGGGGVAATGGATAGAAAGGGGGSYAIGRFTSAFSGVTVTIGAAGGAGGVGANGGNGTATSFGALMSCPGGFGGQGGAPVTPPTFASAVTSGGGAPTGGSIMSTQGNQGECGIALGLGQILSGKGADTQLGAGGLARLNTSAAGVDGTGFGSGGSGASSGSSGAGFLGGNGRPGIVIVYEYA